MEGAQKMKCYKRLIYKLFVQVSSLCGLQFLSYLQKRFTHLCMETRYWCTVLVHQYGRRKSTKTSGIHFFHKSSFFFTRELVYVHINISSNTWNGYTAENQEERLFFNETAFLFCRHALWKLGSSNCSIFEMKHATGLETCTKISFLFVFNLA